MVAVILIGLLYQAFFLMLMGTTPGMMYAGISLCTFENEFPTVTSCAIGWSLCWFRLFPVGLGLAWSIFDEDHLSWHDRISRTYLRKLLRRMASIVKLGRGPIQPRLFSLACIHQVKARNALTPAPISAVSSSGGKHLKRIAEQRAHLHHRLKVRPQRRPGRGNPTLWPVK